jgi:hypothetical protein
MHWQKSLFEDSLASEDEKALEVKKGVIGAKCLLPLLEFFLDETNDFGMRRSVSTSCDKSFPILTKLKDWLALHPACIWLRGKPPEIGHDEGGH